MCYINGASAIIRKNMFGELTPSLVLTFWRMSIQTGSLGRYVLISQERFDVSVQKSFRVGYYELRFHSELNSWDFLIKNRPLGVF